MPRIGMYCSRDILSDKQNDAVLAGVSAVCGEICALPLSKDEVPLAFDVLIIDEPHESVDLALSVLSSNSFILINSDRNINIAIRRCPAHLITYGLNQKACITASSITGDGLCGQMQVCIQRGFPTSMGETAAVQEFPVHMHALGVDATIALVGAMLVCGAKVREVEGVFGFAKLV